MLPITISVKEKPAGSSQRFWRSATRTGFAAVGAHWHSRMLPLHFRPGASTRYGYRPRSRKYLNRKLALARQGVVEDGGQSPNVYTGLMRDLLTSHPIYRVYPTRIAIRMPGPRYVSMRVFQANQPNKGQEVTTVTQGEKRELAAILKQTIKAQYATRKV